MLNYEDGELDQGSVIPMVDGGTEGFRGNARVILPGMTACVECTLDLYPPQVNQTFLDSLRKNSFERILLKNSQNFFQNISEPRCH